MAESQLPFRVQQYNLRPRVAITPKLSGGGDHHRTSDSATELQTAAVPPVRCSVWFGAVAG